MRNIILIITAIAALTDAAQAETIKAHVNGLVCSFCATGIEKVFKKQATVDNIHVDLESKLVTVLTKPQQTMDDKTITTLLTDAGYSVISITREK